MEDLITVKTISRLFAMDYRTKEMEELNLLLRFGRRIQEVVIALCADKEYDHPCLLAFRLVLEIHRTRKRVTSTAK